MKIIYVFILFSFVGCSNIDKVNWISSKDKEQSIGKIRAGDVIIKKKEASPLKIFGHSAIMLTNTLVSDYPKIGEKGYIVDINTWLEDNREFIILRYNQNKALSQKKIVNSIAKYSRKKYKMSLDKKNSDFFYCSQYIWYIFYKTAQENNFYLDIDRNKGKIVFPYDLINFNYFLSIE